MGVLAGEKVMYTFSIQIVYMCQRAQLIALGQSFETP